MEFLVIPDTAAGTVIAEAVCAREQLKVISYASGRPWIVGQWTDSEVTWAAAGQRRVAVLGHTTVTGDRLAKAASGVHTPRDLDSLSCALPGSFHLAAAIDGRVRVQGSLSTARQIFYGTVSGTTVAANRPDTLAQLTGAGIRAELLAARLLAPCPPWPFSEQCLWKGIEALPPGCYLELTAGGDGTPVRWWHPPEPEVPLSVGAARVRSALLDAVAARTRGKQTLSADLSGGMDSTSLCFLAAGNVDRLVTVRWEAADPADEDRDWAQRAAAGLYGAEHLVVTRGEGPMWFADLLTPDPDVEGPFASVRSRSILAHTAEQVAARGSTMHLTGHGGDELFLANPLYLHTLVRQHPLRSVRYLRANRALYRWRLGPTARALLNGDSFGKWLERSTRSFTAPIREAAGRPSFGWGIGYRMPSWATADAVESARNLVRDTARSDPEPLAAVRGQHGVLQDIRICGDTLRRADRLASRSGVSWTAPFTDDRVIEAALSIRFEDSAMPDSYKPALTAAMAGIVPDPFLGRSTKSEYSADAYVSLRRYRPQLLELCDDMNLARLGLVDPGALRSTLISLPPSTLTLVPLISTLACEVWLRSLAATSPEPVPVGGSR